MKLEKYPYHILEDEETLIHKAVAQTWYANSSARKPSNEDKGHRRHVGRRPSRFRLEAAIKSAAIRADCDVKNSLSDSYELLAVYKKLDRGCFKDDEALEGEVANHIRLRVERKHSPKDLDRTFSCRFGSPLDLDRTLSWRFSEVDLSGLVQ